MYVYNSKWKSFSIRHYDYNPFRLERERERQAASPAKPPFQLKSWLRVWKTLYVFIEKAKSIACDTPPCPVHRYRSLFRKWFMREWRGCGNRIPEKMTSIQFIWSVYTRHCVCHVLYYGWVCLCMCFCLSTTCFLPPLYKHLTVNAYYHVPLFYHTRIGSTTVYQMPGTVIKVVIIDYTWSSRVCRLRRRRRSTCVQREPSTPRPNYFFNSPKSLDVS